VPVAFENGLGMRFVLVPPGTFTMGSPPSEKHRDDDEKPHRVALTRPFYLQITEVTNEQRRQWRSWLRSGEGEDRSFEGPEQPALRVSWAEAKEFAEWVETKDSTRSYRLPTEAEWEYAARAGSATIYPWGADAAGVVLHGNVADRAALAANPAWTVFDADDGFVVTSPARSFRANPWGLYDMVGNAQEWVADWFGAYPTTSVSDPKGPASGKQHVARGGAHNSSPRHARVAFRYASDGDPATWTSGLRLAVDVGAR
jgi:formylglycine-generating enzyme required for sulfatase activity